MAAGIADEVFWRSTPAETMALLEAIRERRETEQRAENMRAGLIAAAVYNNNPRRKRGAKPVRPSDFFKAPPKIVSPEEMEAALDQWMASQNARGA